MTSLEDTERWRGLAELSYEELSRQVPITEYKDYTQDISSQRISGRHLLCQDVKRFEPTSGSTEVRKWIPYSQSFLDELNTAASAWLGDMYRRFPSVKKGRHFWSLSWVPDELRAQISSDDVELFPIHQRIILKNTMLIPPAIAKASTSAVAWWASLLLVMACEDLSLVSVWSPTYFLKILEEIEAHYSELKNCLETGSWGTFAPELNSLLGPAPCRNLRDLKFSRDEHFWKTLWPQLSLLSAWDSSTSAIWAEQLKHQLPFVVFQGKGLWATEGVVTIPFKDHKVLAIDSHFYEFKDLESLEVIPAWRVKVGKDYQPILWTSSGLLRYQLQDRVKAVGMFGDTPCFEFISRLQSTDLVGEKIGSQWVSDLLRSRPEWGAISLVAVRWPKPHYILIQTGAGQIQVDIEGELLKHHHYQLARELGQLSEARCCWVQNPIRFLEQNSKSSMLGQSKPEILFEVDQLKI